MVQLNILNGSQAGSRVVARRFPFRVGRGARNDLVSQEPGVWEDHCTLTLDKDGIHLQSSGAAFLSVNQIEVKERRLENGDTIMLGGLKLLFSMSPTRSRGLWFKEALTWAILAGITLGEVALIYWLLVNV
jgi:pSer/pThr/pTyr-binding forkhead associated (FHA) protein